MQQLFMQAFVEQVFTVEAVLSNPVTFASTLINHVDTDIGLPKIIEYNSRGILQHLNMENIKFHLIPGELGRYYVIDEAATKQLVENIKKGVTMGDE
jgi:hypothetical protein